MNGKRNTGAATAMVAALDKELQALDLRKRGMTYQAIADTLGLSQSGHAYEMVMRALKKVLKEPAEELRTLEVERVEQLWEVVFALALAGDLKAVDRCIRLSERRAALLGLDMPQEHLVIASVEVSTVNQLEKLEPAQLTAFLRKLADVSQVVIDGEFTED